MKFRRSFPLFPLVVFCLLALIASPATLAADWKPVDPADLALKAPIVEKDADAEALFWEVRVDDDPDGDLIFSHYVRIKIFTERGREDQSKVDLLFGKIFRSNIKIKEIAGRTIKPDGQIIELKKEDIFERDIVRASGLRARAKSFAMPGVEPGAIIEYRWREVRVNQSAQYIRLQFQRDIPVQRVKYFIKPFPFPGYGMRVQTFNSNADVKIVKEKDGFYSTTMTNMPAYREEPHMPPADEARTWSLLYYSREEKLEPKKYWEQVGKNFYEVVKPLMKVGDEVKQAAAAATEGATTPEEKIDRLFEFTRTKIKNTSINASALTAEERAKVKENKSPSDTLKRGIGTAADIDLLFAALATAAGFEARVALSPDRSDVFFNPNSALAYFVDPAHIAVRIGDQWRFYNPGAAYIPKGMLLWKEEGNPVLITDPKEPAFVQTPLSGPEKSLERRKAKLKLTEDGTLEGDVRIEYTGHLAVERKLSNDEKSPSEREQALRNMIKEQMSTAELSDIQIENATDPVKPFVYTFRVRVPGYAQRTGKRLFLQPAFFQRGVSPVFSTSGRTHQIYFHYPWSEADEVTIELPPGFTLDNPDAPAPFASSNLSRYEVKILTTKDQRTLIYKRNFFFGGGGNELDRLLYGTHVYGTLKNYFDLLHKQDSHTITLKQAAATASN